MDEVLAVLPVYLGLLLAGMVLIGIEMYAPGGVIGALGGLALAGAVVVGFRFPPPWGWWSAMLIVAGCAAGLFWWARIFPHTRAGKKLSLQRDGSDFKSGNPQWKNLEGRTGITLTALRPAGLAEIDGRRVDVTSSVLWIEAGRPVRVVSVQGIRVLVEPVEPDTVS